MSKEFLIVGIGASAGGLESLTSLFKYLPRYINMAFVLVQHLEPHHKSLLAEILARGTSLNIQQAKNNTKVKPGNVYVIPPNSYLSISRRMLKVSLRTRHKDGKYLPVDFFMASLAADQGKKAVGVILSGTGSDGTLGIKAIKAKGGITFAQDEKTARYYGMPAAAIAGGKIDFVLEPAAISGKLIEIAAHKYVMALKKAGPRINKEDSLEMIILLLRDLSGADFIHYKRATVERRITRRMGFRNIKSHSAYYGYLKNNPTEAQALYKDILIPVTMFFRDPKIFTVIRKKLLPRIIKKHSPKNPIRVWVPACSTGEEVYSIAITIYEFLEENNIKPHFHIFGTDLSETLITKARSASYNEDISAHVSAVRLRRFFTKTETGYKIAKHIRDRCIFAKQDITNDSPLSNMDIISCRNLLIYLDQFLQNKVLSVLYYALKPKGFLVLGTAESIASLNDRFTVINKTYKIYAKDITAETFSLGSIIPASKPKPIRKKGARTVKKAVAASGAGKVLPDKYASKNGQARYQVSGAAKPGKEEHEYAKWDFTKLEKELIQTRNRLRVIIEEKDTFNEELTSANEEIQSSNEELQSTNEELETSKEELQSTNEELLTVNEELQNKNSQLTQLNSDLANVLTSVNIPLIIVKGDLRIVRFTPMTRKVMNLIPADVGRPISDIKLNINIPNLEKTILKVVENMIPVESEVQDETGRWYSARIRPYKTTDNKIDGAVISLIDIDVIKRAQSEIKDALDYTTSIVETIHEPLLVLDDDLRVLSANRSFYSMFMVSAHNTEHKFIYAICAGALNVPALRKALKGVVSKRTHFENLEVLIDFANLGNRLLSLNARQVYLRGKEQHMVLLTMEDITKRRKSEDILKRDEKSLQRLVKEQAKGLVSAQAELESAKRLSDIGTLAASVAHELRNPLAAIGMAAHNIKRKINNPDLDKHLANIKKKVLESDQIINNLLFYSRIRPPHHESVDIFGIIEESIDAVKDSCKNDVSVVKNFDSLKDIFIEGDPTQIKEVFNNILNNACDAVPSVEGRVEVIGEPEDEFIKITVTDNGCGVDKASITKVFDPFFTSKAKGTGLGLTVSRQIINLHNGSIDIQSEPGQGTSLTVRLPNRQTKTERKKERRRKWPLNES